MAWLLQLCSSMMLNKLHAAFLLVLGTVTAQAQYTYLDFTYTTLSVNGQYFDLDLNGDTALDFRFILYRDTGTTTSAIDVAIVAPFDSVSAGIFGQQRGLFNYADRLDVGDLIGISSSSWQGMSPTGNYGTIDYRFDSVHDPYSQWQDPYTDGFMGARIQKDGSYLYGWIRLQMAEDGKRFTLKDCAYQAKADSTIEAGHLWISVDEQDLDGYTWMQQGDVVYIERTTAQSHDQVQVFTLEGQTLLTGTWTGDSWAIPTSITRSSMILVVVRHEGHSWVQRIPLR